MRDYKLLIVLISSSCKIQCSLVCDKAECHAVTHLNRGQANIPYWGNMLTKMFLWN